MGIVKINDELHQDLRLASDAMMRSINAQAEFWIKIGMLAELNPTLTYRDILQQQLGVLAPVVRVEPAPQQESA